MRCHDENARNLALKTKSARAANRAVSAETRKVGGEHAAALTGRQRDGHQNHKEKVVEQIRADRSADVAARGAQAVSRAATPSALARPAAAGESLFCGVCAVAHAAELVVVSSLGALADVLSLSVCADPAVELAPSFIVVDEAVDEADCGSGAASGASVSATGAGAGAGMNSDVSGDSAACGTAGAVASASH